MDSCPSKSSGSRIKHVEIIKGGLVAPETNKAEERLEIILEYIYVLQKIYIFYIFIYSFLYFYILKKKLYLYIFICTI